MGKKKKNKKKGEESPLKKHKHKSEKKLPPASFAEAGTSVKDAADNDLLQIDASENDKSKHNVMKSNAQENAAQKSTALVSTAQESTAQVNIAQVSKPQAGGAQKNISPNGSISEHHAAEESKKSAAGTAKLRSSEAEIQMLPIFQALSDENRLKIIRLLTIRGRTTPELLEQVDVVQSTMSHHLKILTEAGLISCQKKGKRSCYFIRPDTFAQIGAYFTSQNPSIND